MRTPYERLVETHNRWGSEEYIADSQTGIRIVGERLPVG